MARFVSFLVLVAILVIISIIFFQVMAGFFVPLFLAALLAVVVQPLYRWALAKCRGYRHFAAGITTALVALIVLFPIGLAVSTAALEGLSLIDQLQLKNVRDKLAQLRHDFNLEIPREQDVRHIEAAMHFWREKQRRGESVEIKPEQVNNLIVRAGNLQQWIKDKHLEALRQRVVARVDDAELADAEQSAAKAEQFAEETVAPLRTALESLREAPAGSVEQDSALLSTDAEFRELKRQILGGTYRAWLTEWANPSDEQVERLRGTVLSTAGPVLSLGSGTAVLVAKLGFGMLIVIVTLFFMLAEGPGMLEAVIRVSPLEEQHVRELAAEFDRACRAIVSATLLSALAQGLLAGAGFYFCGLRSSVALLTLLTMVLALVPFTGAAAVWLPVSLYLYFYQGSTFAAIGLAIYGAVIISGADNVIKPLVLHGQSNLHPLLALLSVIGGVQALGPIGIIVGPMVVVFLQTLLKIVQRELMSMDRSSWTFWRGFGRDEPAASGPVATTAAPSPLGNGQPSALAKPAQQPQRKKHRK